MYIKKDDMEVLYAVEAFLKEKSKVESDVRLQFAFSEIIRNLEKENDRAKKQSVESARRYRQTERGKEKNRESSRKRSQAYRERQKAKAMAEAETKK